MFDRQQSLILLLKLLEFICRPRATDREAKDVVDDAESGFSDTNNDEESQSSYRTAASASTSSGRVNISNKSI